MNFKLDRLVHLLPEAIVTAGLYALLLTVFAGERLLLLWRNSHFAAGTPIAVLLQSFLVGLRFDLAIASYLLIPTFLLLLLPRRRGLVLAGFSALTAVLILLGLAEAEFYREMEMRYNGLVFQYLDHPDIVGVMLWEGSPVGRYLLLWAASTLAFAGGVFLLHRRLLRRSTAGRCAGTLPRTMTAAAVLALMIFASRGGFAHEPLRWGDAYFSQHPFANHLALNGLFTLSRSLLERDGKEQGYWTKAQPAAEAERTTRKMLRLADERDLGSDLFPILRQQAAGAGRSLLEKQPERPVNVVVILMESFSARQVGALGANPSLTPEFDRLCAEGILFERAFSNGTHTHQGVFASFASFPNVPGYEYLMQRLEASQELSGLPTLFSRQGYRTVFLYNGLFSWDNKEGFFRRHGIERFIGSDDYVDPTFVDPVWGVSDQDVFTRANREFRTMAAQGPFFGAILTLSNHFPFNLPDPLPFERVRTGDDREGRSNAMRYADWALGEFFRRARQEAYFADTLFVLTGDHGFGTPPTITDMQLERHHVPLLFYAPGLLAEKGSRRRTVASQVDIGASVLGLLGLEIPHQSWGRNLFSPALRDEGFAVVKPSGGEQKVALIEGDFALIEAPGETPRLYRFDLGFPPQAQQLTGEEKRTREMKGRLDAYVETAILALREHRLGLPERSEGIGGGKRGKTAGALTPCGPGHR